MHLLKDESKRKKDLQFLYYKSPFIGLTMALRENNQHALLVN